MVVPVQERFPEWYAVTLVEVIGRTRGLLAIPQFGRGLSPPYRSSAYPLKVPCVTHVLILAASQCGQGVVLSPPLPPLRAGLAVSVSEAALAVPRFSLRDV